MTYRSLSTETYYMEVFVGLIFGKVTLLETIWTYWSSPVSSPTRFHVGAGISFLFWRVSYLPWIRWLLCQTRDRYFFNSFWVFRGVVFLFWDFLCLSCFTYWFCNLFKFEALFFLFLGGSLSILITLFKIEALHLLFVGRSLVLVLSFLLVLRFLFVEFSYF